MPYVTVKILLPVQAQHLLHRSQRHPPGTGLAPPPVVQPIVAAPLVPPLPPPHLPVTDADDLRCLPPRNPFPDRPQNHFLYLHRPLHCGCRVELHAPSSQKALPYHRSKPDISCANDSHALFPLTSNLCGDINRPAWSGSSEVERSNSYWRVRMRHRTL